MKWAYAICTLYCISIHTLFWVSILCNNIVYYIVMCITFTYIWSCPHDCHTPRFWKIYWIQYQKHVFMKCISNCIQQNIMGSIYLTMFRFNIHTSAHLASRKCLWPASISSLYWMFYRNRFHIRCRYSCSSCEKIMVFMLLYSWNMYQIF